MIRKIFKQYILKSYGWYHLLLLYFFYADSDSNFFICSYLLTNFTSFLPYQNVIIALVHLYFFIFIKLRRKKKMRVRARIYLSDFLILVFLFNIYKTHLTIKKLLYLINLSANKLIFFFFNALKITKNCSMVLVNFKNEIWVPLFKKYSYFGFYRINRTAHISYSTNSFILIKS